MVLFFTKGAPTQKVWYYQLDPGRTLRKTTPLNDDDLKEFVKLQKKFKASEKSWSVDVNDIDLDNGCDLSVKNPNAPEATPLREPSEIIEEIRQLDAETAAILEEIGGML